MKIYCKILRLLYESDRPLTFREVLTLTGFKYSTVKQSLIRLARYKSIIAIDHREGVIQKKYAIRKFKTLKSHANLLKFIGREDEVYREKWLALKKQIDED